MAKKYVAEINGEFVQVDGVEEAKQLITSGTSFTMYGLVCQQKCDTSCVYYAGGTCPFYRIKDKDGVELMVLKIHHGEAITLINPKGEQKELTNVGFYELKMQFAKSATVIQWAKARHISLWKKKEDGWMLIVSAVDKFLEEKGYKVINNMINI